MISEITPWISIDEAARYLKVGKTKLYDLAQNGKIPAIKIDKQWRFKTADLDRWLSTSQTIEKYFTSATYKIEDNLQLREPQREAYKALYDFFKAGGREALVQLPVGCGKTGLVAIAPFGISKGRVLVVTPNLTIKDEVKNNLDITHRKCFWRKAGVLEAVDMVSGPYVTTLNTGNTSVTDSSHFVVTNVQQLATNDDKWLNKFPSDYFDMIIVDEAHHNQAESWQKVALHFPAAKIINLTATPFRSDLKEVSGERVYRYSFRSAVSKGYIKRLTAVYVSPKEQIISFKGDNERHTYTLDDVLGMKDKDWFSRGIAMSEECNKSIIDNSIQKMELLRNDSSIKHQIIAAAMSINHAEKIKLLYEERNYEAAVIHSKMKEDDQQAVIKKLKANELDVIINVQMLGEGFDHPPLSVAAIFTPYRSLKPYLQFVGRIMRVNIQNAPGDPDNYGYIISHVGMNLDALLDQFQLFEKDDEEFWAEVTGGEEPEPPLPRGIGGGRMNLSAPLTVHGEIVEDLYEEAFVDDDEQSRLRELKEMLEATGFDASKAELILKGQKTESTKVTPAAYPMAIQPQKELERLRKQLPIEVRTKAKAVLANARLSIVGQDIPRRLFSDLPAQNNLVAVIVMINRHLKIKVDNKERDDWSREDYRLAMDALPSVSSALVRQIIAAKEARDAKR
jgi:excisionase family DNA binding protein